MSLKAKLSAVAVSVALLSACNNGDSNNSNQNPEQPQSSNYVQMIDALGGSQVISSSSQFLIEVQGQSFDSHEAPEPQERLIANYSYKLEATIDANRLNQQWHIDSDYAFVTKLDFTEVIDGEQGVVLDGPNTFASYAFGVFGVPAEPMTSAKVAARQKTWFMSSPLVIVNKMINDQDEALQQKLNVNFKGYQISLVLDPESHLPKTATTIEYDPLLGDVAYEVAYSDWQVEGETLYPHKIIHRLDGEVIREETVSSVQVIATDDLAFAFEASEGNTINKEKAASGYLSSLFYGRGMMMGFPFADVEETHIVSDFIDSDNKVLRITGIEHYNYAFQIDEQIYIFDAPINNQRQLAVVEEVKRKFPDMPIAGVILSHDHFDHAGGFRGALSSGGDLIVGSSSKDSYQELLARPHTLQPNPIAQRGAVNIVGVEGKMTLGESSETLEIYTVSQGHANEGDMLVLYRPESKTVFFADLYNSGFSVLQGFYPNLAPTIQQRAKMLVDFVNAKQLDVVNIAPLHGDVANDTSYESVKAAAAFSN